MLLTGDYAQWDRTSSNLNSRQIWSRAISIHITDKFKSLLASDYLELIASFKTDITDDIWTTQVFTTAFFLQTNKNRTRKCFGGTHYSIHSTYK